MPPISKSAFSEFSISLTSLPNSLANEAEIGVTRICKRQDGRDRSNGPREKHEESPHVRYPSNQEHERRRDKGGRRISGGDGSVTFTPVPIVSVQYRAARAVEDPTGSCH